MRKCIRWRSFGLTGFGERAHLLSIRPTLETFIEDIAQTLRYEDLHDVILVGHGFAGSVVSALADRMPERLRVQRWVRPPLLAGQRFRQPEHVGGLFLEISTKLIRRHE